MIHSYSDGTRIELSWGDSRPPDVKTGQHTTATLPWARMDGGTWRPVRGIRSHHKTLEWIRAADTADEAMSIICPDEAGGAA